MALWPNGRYLTQSPYRFFGPGAGLEVYARGTSDRLCRYINSNYLSTASTPDGYGMSAYVPPIVAGSISSLTTALSFEGSGYLLQGGPMSADVAILTTTGSASLSLIVSLAGNVTLLSFTGSGSLNLTVGLSGSGMFTLFGTSSLSLIVPFEGIGHITFVGSADLKGLLSLSGQWTPYTELSPENLARAVWDSLASEFNDPGTMGQKLNAAGSAGDPWTTELPSTYVGNQAGRILYNLIAFVRNKKFLAKEGSTWYLIIRNDNDSANLLKKPLKDKDGGEISDLEAGILAQELASL